MKSFCLILGHPANLKDSFNPEWTPTLNMGYEKKTNVKWNIEDGALQ
jgi:hypothetical protein